MATPVLGPALVRWTPFLRIVLRMGVRRGFRWDKRELDLYADSFRRPDHAWASSAVYRTFLLRELGPLLRGRYNDRRLEIPVTMVAAEHDPVVTPKRLSDAAEHVPNGRRVILDGMGHFLPEEDPQRVIELIRG
jgi:pimeloyl-ACP methyl ester carboxylesterase